MKVNPKLVTHQHPYLNTDKPTGNARRLSKKTGDTYAAPRTPDIAPPKTHTTLQDKGTYRLGMGDYFHAPMRPGADHSHIKSIGNKC